LTELKEYGEINVEACFNCGNCTAVCPLTSDEHPFPRKSIRLLQLGLKDQLLADADPWLCYYCGDCSTTCPRGAEPAEAMMTLRRWLTAQYDRSKHGAKMYTSGKAAWAAIARYSLVPVALLVVFHVLTALGVSGFGRIVTDRVELNSFAPVWWVWAFVLVDFAILGGRLFANISRMHNLVMESANHGAKIPLRTYLQEWKALAVNFTTQKRWLDCGEDRSRWFKHLLLVSGYVTMLILIVGLLWWFQTDKIFPLWHPQRWLGYYATIVLLYTSGEALVGRIRKREQIHRFSQHTDWLFPAFLFTGALTGILVHIFRYAGWPWPTYIMYTVHLMAMVAMLDTEVGIGKWTHLLYRPLAIYFEAVKERAEQDQTSMATAPAGTN
jgi:ferredoxin